MHINTRGLVLRETDYKDGDKLLTVLTGDGGKCTVKARGCRRRGSRLTAAAQQLVYSDMTLFEYRDRLTLNEAETLEQFPLVRSDVTLLSLGMYFAEVMEAVAEEGRGEPALLSLILNSLYALDKLHKPPVLVKAAFELRLMCLVGYEPSLDGCAVCGAEEPEGPMLHLTEGLLCCRSCLDRVGPGRVSPLDRDSLAALRHVTYGDPKRLFSFRLPDEGARQMAEACEDFLLTQLDRPFRTLDFYHQMAGLWAGFADPGSSS